MPFSRQSSPASWLFSSTLLSHFITFSGQDCSLSSWTSHAKILLAVHTPKPDWSQIPPMQTTPSPPLTHRFTIPVLCQRQSPFPPLVPMAKLLIWLKITPLGQELYHCGYLTSCHFLQSITKIILSRPQQLSFAQCSPPLYLLHYLINNFLPSDFI